MRWRWCEETEKFLESEVQVRVRFHEVDALQVVWHGHYLQYFEEARTAFGREHQLAYEDLYRAGYLAPIVRVEIDYVAPSGLGDVLTIRARLYPDLGARINFSYLVTNSSGQRLATGRTIQVFTDLSGSLVFTRPPFFQQFLHRWEHKLRAESKDRDHRSGDPDRPGARPGSHP